MSDTHSQQSQAKGKLKQSSDQNADLAALRRSKRQKTPSLLYANGFEDTQKVIGRKGNPKSFRSLNKNGNDNLSTSEKEMDTKMEEETTDRGVSYSEKMEYEDEDEYLAFVKLEDVDNNSDDRIGFVMFKIQGAEEAKSATRKLKKKAPYGEDFAYGIDPKKPKDKLKAQQKKIKGPTKGAQSAPSTQDFLDIVLSAAIKAQASQTNNDSTPTPRSPRNNYNSITPNVHMSGKVSAPKFGGLEDKPMGIMKKTKASVKKSEPAKAYNATNEEFYQRHLEYKDHYIKEAVIEGDNIVLKHTKNAPVTMKYQKKKFDLRKKELVDSKIFDVIAEEGKPMGEEENENNQENMDENEWKKRLEMKQKALAVHFKEVLKEFKPSILA